MSYHSNPEFNLAQLAYLMPNYRVVMDSMPNMKPWVYLSYVLSPNLPLRSPGPVDYYGYHVITDGDTIMEVVNFLAAPHRDLIVDPLTIFADMKKYVNSL